MLEPFEAICKSFYASIGWDEENAYSSLNNASKHLLHFDTPQGVHLNVSSLASLNYASSYRISLLGPLDGSIAYLYSSKPLLGVRSSANVDLKHVIGGQRGLHGGPPDQREWEVWHGGKRADKKDTLMYGKMFPPKSRLEALLIRRLSPSNLLLIRALSEPKSTDRGTLTAQIHQNHGKWAMEYLYSTNESLIGLRGLYNFGQITSDDRLSAGAEAYYALASKVGGISTGLRYSSQSGTPVTMTMQWNPLLGHICASYSVQGGGNQAFSTRYDFNMFSYESDLAIACELWRSAWSGPTAPKVAGVVKARLAKKKIGLLWEGRINNALLVSLGGNIDLGNRSALVTQLGLDIQFSS